MNPIPTFAICAWCMNWTNSDIMSIQQEAASEFIPEVNPIITAYNSSMEIDETYCDIIIEVTSDIKKCSDLPASATHESYCREWQGDDEDRPKYRVYIEKVNICKEKWTADISTQAIGNVKVIGKLLQHCILTHLGLRILDHTDPLDENSEQHYSMCTGMTVIPDSKITASDLVKMDKRVREAAECPGKAKDSIVIPVLTKTFIVLIVLYIFIQIAICLAADHTSHLRRLRV